MPARKEKKRERCRSFACRPLAPGYKTRLFLLKNVKKQKHLKGYFCFLVEELTGRSSEDFELSEEDHEMLHHWESMLQLKRIYILHKISNQITRKRVAYSLFFYFHQLNHSTDVIERERKRVRTDGALCYSFCSCCYIEKNVGGRELPMFSPPFCSPTGHMATGRRVCLGSVTTGRDWTRCTLCFPPSACCCCVVAVEGIPFAVGSQSAAASNKRSNGGSNKLPSLSLMTGPASSKWMERNDDGGNQSILYSLKMPSIFCFQFSHLDTLLPHT